MLSLSMCLAGVLLTALPGVPADADLEAGFNTPLAEFSPVPIWWWSGDQVEREQVKTQLERLAQGGIHNAMILNLAPSGPLYGSAADEPPFLSEAWWDLFGYALGEGKRVGVRLWFYDQLGFSGSGLQARVVREHPEFRGITLHREVRDVDGPASVEIPVPPAGTALAAFSAFLTETPKRPGEARWIWDAKQLEGTCKRYFRRTFDLSSVPAKARITLTCDDGYVLFVNGTQLGEEHILDKDGWSRAEGFDIAPQLRAGKNVVAIVGENQANLAGLLVQITLGEGDTARKIVSDNSFRLSETAPDGWTGPDFDDSLWVLAKELGSIPMAPWGVVQGFPTGGGAFYGTPIRGVSNLTGQIKDGALRCEVPQGKQRVMLFYTAAGGFDYQNPDAGAALLNVVHGELERRFPEELGKSIAGSFQDEFPELPRFSKRMIERFVQYAGYKIEDKLPALYDDVTDKFQDSNGPTTAQIRCDASRVAAQLCEEAFFIPLQRWHEKYGMLCGYDQCVRNADPLRGEAYYVDYFKTMRHFSAPGNDMDGDAKPHESIADLYTQPRVWIEAFHSSGWGQTLEEIATLTHPWFANGATLFNPHAIYYSIHGSYWEWAPPDTGWRQPYFVHYPVFANYVSRLCHVLARGEHVVHAAVVHPSATVHAYSGFGDAGAAAEEASDLYWDVQNTLQKDRLDYIVIDEDSIQKAAVRKGELIAGQVRLNTLFLPGARVLAGKTVEKLGIFAEAGGKVIFLGPLPEAQSDQTLAPDEFKQLLAVMLKGGIRVDDAATAVQEARPRVTPAVAEAVPAIERRIGDRDFFFLLSDDGTPAKGQARYDINGRKLYETAAAQGARWPVTLASDGIPQYWNAVNGEITSLYNYRRLPKTETQAAGTRVDLDLAVTPAPLISIRAPKPEDPIAIESDLEITGFKRDGDSLTLDGFTRLDNTRPVPQKNEVRAEFADALFEASQAAVPPKKISVDGPLACRLESTCDNQDGSFAWPPSAGAIPVETRAFRFHEEKPGEDTGALARPDFDDAAWNVALASFGPRAEWAGPIAAKLEELAPPLPEQKDWHAAAYSLKLGIDEDPVFASALGGKGRIPEEFIDLGEVKGGEVYAVRATVLLPADAATATEGLKATLRVGCVAKKRVFLNGQEVALEGSPETRVQRAETLLKPGPNRLELLLARPEEGELRLFYQFAPSGEMPPDPEWIWSAAPSPTGKTTFTRTFDVPGAIRSAAMVVALGGIHQIRINGELVADQGNFDPYFTSRAERYDLARFVKTGANTLEIEAGDAGEPVGLLLDGLVTTEDGKEVAFVSDASFSAAPSGVANAPALPAHLLAGPAHGYMGDPANLLLRPRPHPLPHAGWLLNQPAPPAPFDQLAYAVNETTPAPGWFRFLLPPGATALNLETPGEAKLYVNGTEVALQKNGAAYTGGLPNADAPRRMAALRIQSLPGFAQGAAITAPITYTMGPGKMPFGSWDELGLPHYAGGVVYTAEVTLPEKITGRVVLDLGRVRGSADVSVNDAACGARIWHPYRFDLTQAVKPGVNTIEIRVFNTLGPHFALGHPSQHVRENQTTSGLFGPVSVNLLPHVEFTISKKKQDQHKTP